jgi:hypothetical protein
MMRRWLRPVRRPFRHGVVRAMCAGREVAKLMIADGRIAAPKVGRVRATGMVATGKAGVAAII